jgi:hypothetical protein
MLAMPVFWLSFLVEGRTRISSWYGPPLLLIVIATCLSALHAPNPTRGAIVLLKELYLFAWFVTLIGLFAGLSARALRRVMAVWAAVVTLHAVVILAQFLFPPVWHATIGLAGQSREYANFRASGFFVSDKAGDANKAAFFQLLGFVPLLLARLRKSVTLPLATLLFLSILATGSMGTTVALSVGISVAALLLLLVDGSLRFFSKYVTQLALVATVLGVSLAVVLVQNPAYRDHLSSIITGRAEKSSGGRFALWQRGLAAFEEHDVLIWGVGPENFREVDPSGNDNQLHNDTLAFLVERGAMGALGLILIAAVAIARAVHLLRIHSVAGNRDGAPDAAVFLAAIAAVVMASLTHQIFHARELWIVLAVQEGMILQAEGARGARQAMSWITPMSYAAQSRVTS